MFDNNYTPPPGRPQAVPPGLRDVTPPEIEVGPDGLQRPVRLPNEAARAYANRVAAWRMANVPGRRDQIRQSLSEGHKAANAKLRNKFARDCNRLNLTETKGRWYTVEMIMRDTGRTDAAASNFVNRYAVDKVSEGMARRYLIPTEKLPSLFKTKSEASAPPAPPAPPAKAKLGREIVVRRIEVTTDQLEEFLTTMLGLKSPRFHWTTTGVDITVEEAAR